MGRATALQFVFEYRRQLPQAPVCSQNGRAWWMGVQDVTTSRSGSPVQGCHPRKIFKILDANSCLMAHSLPKRLAPAVAQNTTHFRSRHIYYVHPARGNTKKWDNWCPGHAGQDYDGKLDRGASKRGIPAKMGRVATVQCTSVYMMMMMICVCCQVDSSSTSLSSPLNLRGHRAPVVTVDWSTSVHACLTASLDGHICVSSLLMQ